MRATSVQWMAGGGFRAGARAGMSFLRAAKRTQPECILPMATVSADETAPCATNCLSSAFVHGTRWGAGIPEKPNGGITG
jgi:hypothetical protein